MMQTGAGYPSLQRSTSSFCIFHGKNLISWSSKWHLMVSWSNDEAEYIRGYKCCHWNMLDAKYLAWTSLTYMESYYLIMCIVYLYNNSIQHKWTNYINIDIHFVCDKAATDHDHVIHAPLSLQYANILWHPQNHGRKRPIFILILK